MTRKGKEKLADYLDGFAMLNYDGITPIGAILIDGKSSKDVLEELRNFGFAEIPGSGEPLKPTGESSQFLAGKKTFIRISSEFSAKMFNFFLEVTRGKIPGTKILFVIPTKIYDNYAAFDRIVSSVCRL